MDTTTRIQIEGRSLEIERTFGRIDMDNLTKEVAEGNSESTWWGILFAKAKAEAARAKARIDVVKAEAAKRKRLWYEANHKTYTVDVIKEEVITDADVQASIEAHIVAEERSGILEAAKEGSAGKARTLEKLSNLVGQEYSATRPSPDVHIRKRPSPSKSADTGGTPAGSVVTKRPVE